MAPLGRHCLACQRCEASARSPHRDPRNSLTSRSPSRRQIEPATLEFTLFSVVIFSLAHCWTSQQWRHSSATRRQLTVSMASRLEKVAVSFLR